MKEAACSIPFSAYIPKNSTQLISISSWSPSADKGTSSSRLRRTKGPVSGALRFLCLELGVSSTSCDAIFRGARAQFDIISWSKIQTQLDVVGDIKPAHAERWEKQEGCLIWEKAAIAGISPKEFTRSVRTQRFPTHTSQICSDVDIH